MPIQVPIKKPIPRYPDITDPSLCGSWLNKRVANSGRDFSVAGDDMVIGGSPEPLEDGGYLFGGSADYFRRGEANWRNQDSVGTILAWMNMDAIGATQAIFSSDDEGSNSYNFEFLVNSTGQIQISQRNAGDVLDRVKSTNSVIATSWNLVGLVSIGTKWILYMDGEPETPIIVSGSNNGDWLAETTQRDNITIGVRQRNTLEHYFAGMIKEVNYFSEAKSSEWWSEQFDLGVPE